MMAGKARAIMSSDHHDHRPTKAELRRAYRTQQRHLEPAIRAAEERDVARHLRRVLEQRRPGVVASYRSLPRELSLDGLVAEFPFIRWVFPRVAGRALEFVEASHLERDFVRGPFNLQEPVGEAMDPHDIELMFMPAVACDPTGVRLGQGGGYYDALLARFPHLKSSAIVVLFTVQMAPPRSLPSEPHDQKIAFIATAQGVFNISTQTHTSSEENTLSSGFHIGGHEP